MGSMTSVFDVIVHRMLRVAYTLNVRYKRILPGAKVTYVFIHGLGDTADLWAGTIGELPHNVNYIAMDLVGFGDSPKPAWARYDAKMQARSVLQTCLASGIFGPVTVVGHSLGALVAVEFARRYPLAVRRLILCSPPIYDTQPGRAARQLQQNALHRIYGELAKNPKLIMNAYAFGKKLRLINQSFQVTPETLPAFLASLQTSIMNQDTIQHIERIHVPIVIIDGQFDVLTINSILKQIAKRHKNMRLITIPAAHVIMGRYQKQLVSLLREQLQ